MKKILGVLLALLVILSCKNVSALEYTYSEWSTSYPSGMDPVFIESEVRYKWYTFEDNRIIYTDEYYTEYEGYIKDEASETTFYRYITDSKVYLDKYNNIVTDENYCNKNFCYAIKYVEPTMVDMTEKTENKYESSDIYEYDSVVVPMTGDSIIYSFIFLLISAISITYFVIKKRKSMSIE